MQVSKRFLALLEQQLAQFTDRQDLQELVVYVAVPDEEGQPSLVAIGHWPPARALTAPNSTAANNNENATTGRRWLALRDNAMLLGALRVDAERWPWPDSLNQRLDATARCLTEALRLDLERQRLGRELSQRDDQLQLLVHQLRNPLAALRTFGQLLRKRLDGDSRNQPLVEGLLAEQNQIARYVTAIDRLAEAPALLRSDNSDNNASKPLLPAGLSSNNAEPLEHILQPLLERAAATAHLQNRPWHPPTVIPPWRGDEGALTEILANLLENAFRYSQSGGAIGLLCRLEEKVELCVWDSGPAIPAEERKGIFSKGVRGSTGRHCEGSGLGLALALDLARGLGGDLELVVPARQLDSQLPSTGNAFVISLPLASSG
jgi:hypothetical protein